MSRQRSARRDLTRSATRTEITEDELANNDRMGTRIKRLATVYDAVAGRVGLNGFLTQEQLASDILPSLPEEVLLRRISAPDEIPYDFYNADEDLPADQKLPDSELLKALHSYTSDFYSATTIDMGQRDFRVFDGSSLLALGILLEEASKEALGENGDMALVEPEGLENGLPESSMVKHQIIGKVKPRKVLEEQRRSGSSDESEIEGIQRKRRRIQT